jgi:hypothetical protein
MRVRSGTPMRGLRGLGVSPCDINFVGPLTPDQQAACLAQIPTSRTVGAADQTGVTEDQLQNIKDFFYQAGQDASASTLPSWVLPAGIGLLFLVMLKGGRR